LPTDLTEELDDDKLFKNTILLPKTRSDDLVSADTGSSSIIRYDYT